MGIMSVKGNKTFMKVGLQSVVWVTCCELYFKLPTKHRSKLYRSVHLELCRYVQLENTNPFGYKIYSIFSLILP